jgi:phosphoglycolate phosphatase-like HAD superfamily hydrolase
MSDHVQRDSPRAAVIDIDGVLADVRWRLHHIEGPRRDWDAFFAGASQDPVLAQGRAHVLEARAQGLSIVYATGRPERCRPDTVRWLGSHGMPDGDLRMRGDRDRRPARMVKVGWLRELARTHAVAYILDDDPQVLSAARAAGFEACAADWMPRAESLDAAQEVLGRS